MSTASSWLRDVTMPRDEPANFSCLECREGSSFVLLACTSDQKNRGEMQSYGLSPGSKTALLWQEARDAVGHVASRVGCLPGRVSTGAVGSGDAAEGAGGCVKTPSWMQLGPVVELREVRQSQSASVTRQNKTRERTLFHSAMLALARR
jgi:hypothetical protein